MVSECKHSSLVGSLLTLKCRRLLFKYSGAAESEAIADAIAECDHPKQKAVQHLLQLTRHLGVTDIDFLPP